MSIVEPKLVIRLGSHAEKDYVIKMSKFLDGFMVAGNLVEATPGATGSLLIKFGGEIQKLPFYIDPMTYGFAEDLRLLKSEQKRKKKVEFDFKRSYKRLASQFGGVFENVIDDDTPLQLSDLQKQDVIEEIVESVADYQLNRIRNEFLQHTDLASFEQSVPSPAAILTPYFYCKGKNFSDWADLIPQIAKATVALNKGIPVHAVVCATQDLLLDSAARKKLIKGLNESGCQGVWLWFTALNEYTVDTTTLVALRTLTEELSENLEVHNMHGGFFSLALSKYGMASTAHGVGYGEQKDIAPIQGQAMPTVRYYLPPVARRLGVPDIERTFNSLGITSVAKFHEQICDCVICKGVVKNNLSEFSSFGDKHLASPTSKRKSQTPAAAKRCRFHFMLNRIREVKEVSGRTLEQVITNLTDSKSAWESEPSISSDIRFLSRWISALSPEETA